MSSVASLPADPLSLAKGESRRQRIVQYLSRETSGGRYLPAVDGIRFLAIMLVVAMHAYVYPSEEYAGLTSDATTGGAWLLAASGGWGVPLFFCLSGFILSLPFARQFAGLGRPVDLKRYFVRRVTRLEPPYIMAILLVLGLKLASNAAAPEEGWLTHFLTTITYSNWLFFGDKSEILSVAWSLEVEVQFYILAPLFAAVFALKRRTRWALLVLMMVIPPLIGMTVAPLPRYNLLGYLHCFAAGFLLTDLFLFSNIYDENRSSSRYGWDLAVVGACLAATYVWSMGYVMHAWVAPFALIVCVGVMRGGWTRAFFEMPFVRITGGMCYTIYLLHRPIQAAVYKAIGIGSFVVADSFFLTFLVLFGVSTVVVLALSTVFFALIERPCMAPDWVDKVRARFGRLRPVDQTVT